MEEQINYAGGGGEPRYVGFWLRVVATIVDSIWTGIVIGAVVFALFGEQIMAIAQLGAEASPEEAAAVMAAYGQGMMVETLLFTIIIIGFWIWKSATPGKMLVSAVIVDAKTLGKPSTGQFVVRYVGYIVSSLVFGLGFLWVAFDRRKQGWHDKMAGTVVIKK
jgi:uncharacterized RDD family membrane protein YckC